MRSEDYDAMVRAYDAPPNDPPDDLVPTDEDEWPREPTLNPALWAFFAGQVVGSGMGLARALRDLLADNDGAIARAAHALGQWEATLYRLDSWREQP